MNCRKPNGMFRREVIYGSKPSPDYDQKGKKTSIDIFSWFVDNPKLIRILHTRMSGPKTFETLAPMFNRRLMPTNSHVLGSNAHSMICRHLKE